MRAFVPLLAAGLCALAFAAPAQAQTGNAAARSLPNPAGLRPMYPAGISSGSGAAQSTSPVARANSPVPAGQPAPTTSTGVGGIAVPTELFPVDNGGGVATNVLGAGATSPGPSQYLNSGAGGVSAADEARSFFFADANHDGELSRAEARRLSIATMSFEQMDRNFDGVISRFEYQDSLR
jgi:hypothetical protein